MIDNVRRMMFSSYHVSNLTGGEASEMNKSEFVGFGVGKARGRLKSGFLRHVRRQLR